MEAGGKPWLGMSTCPWGTSAQLSSALFPLLSTGCESPFMASICLVTLFPNPRPSGRVNTVAFFAFLLEDVLGSRGWRPLPQLTGFYSMNTAQMAPSFCTLSLILRSWTLLCPYHPLLTLPLPIAFSRLLPLTLFLS